MWNNAGLSTSILITTCSPANGMIHHAVAKIFVSTKLRDLGPKSSAARTFWRMVATCIRYQPPTEHLFWDLTTFNLASIKTPCVGTSFLGLAYPYFPPQGSDETPELPQFLPICDRVLSIGGNDVFRLAVFTPLPPVGILEAVLLSLKEGETLSESTIRRLRRKEAERRAAQAEGRTPVSEYRRRKLKKIAAKASVSQEPWRPSSEKDSPALREPGVAPAQRPSRGLHQTPTVQPVATTVNVNSECRKVSAEDIERLAATVSVRRRPNNQSTVPPSHA